MRGLVYIAMACVAAISTAATMTDIRETEDRAAEGDARAIYALRDSANGGNTRAMNFLGFLYWQGKGTHMNQDSALFYIRKAADLGDAKALGNYGHLLLRGSVILPSDTIEAIRYLGKAVEKGNIAAMRELNDFLHVYHDYDTINPGAIKKIADAYSHGYPLAYDYRKSVELYYRASLAGDTVSQRIIDELVQMFPDILKQTTR